MASVGHILRTCRGCPRLGICHLDVALAPGSEILLIELDVPQALVDELPRDTAREVFRTLALQFIEVELCLGRSLRRVDVELLAADCAAPAMDVHEEPPHAGVDPDVVDAQPKATADHVGVVLVEQPLVCDDAGRAHLSNVRDVLRAHVALPLVYPEGIYQVPALAIASVLRVVLGHEIELCLFPVVIGTEVRLALAADLQRVYGRAATVLLHEGGEQAPGDGNKRLGGHLRRAGAQELVRAKILEVVQRPWLAHSGQPHIPVLRDENDIQIRRWIPVEASHGRPVMSHLLGDSIIDTSIQRQGTLPGRGS
mmetsp:Transcript_59877/g.131370  ORF Transcript_59877/g.131370 Transcript_59877/m.131370 type:complete len:311 (-) Transcript_59877:1138-2070(-)